RGAGENHIARLQGHRATEMGDLIENVEDQMPGVGILPALVVHETANSQGMRIAELIRRDNPRTNRRVSIKRLAEHPLRRLELPVPHRNIITRAKSKDYFRSALFGHMLAASSDDHDELRLVVGLCGSARKLDRIERSVDRGHRFGEPNLMG